MSYQIVVMDIETDTDGKMPIAWSPFDEAHVEKLVGVFTTAGKKPNAQQLLRLSRFASRLQQLIPPADPMWAGCEPLTDVLALDTKGWILNVEPVHAERLLRALLPLARQLRLAVADQHTGLYCQPGDPNWVIPHNAMPAWQALDPDVQPENKALTKAAMYKAFAERFAAPLLELGLSRIDPGWSPSCTFARERNGIRCELGVMHQGRPSNPSAKVELTIYSERAATLRALAEHDLLGTPIEQCNKFGLVVTLPVAGQVWAKSGETVSYDSCRSLEELNWLADVALQRLATMVAMTDSIAGVNVLNREFLRMRWHNQSTYAQLFDYAYLIWGNQIAEFEELAARQLEWHRQSGQPTYGFELERLIDYCRSTLKPDPDGQP